MLLNLNALIQRGNHVRSVDLAKRDHRLVVHGQLIFSILVLFARTSLAPAAAANLGSAASSVQRQGAGAILLVRCGAPAAAHQLISAVALGEQVRQ